jgi:hypothetical protein
MTPAQTWLLIALGIPMLMLMAWIVTYWLEGRDPDPPPFVVQEHRRCECGRFVFVNFPDPNPRHHHHGTVHRPDLCQPADEAL